MGTVASREAVDNVDAGLVRKGRKFGGGDVSKFSYASTLHIASSLH